MDVSVVCPFYNEAEIIGQAVWSLIDQLRLLQGDWELIVVNDGSTDGSEKVVHRIAEECPRVRVLGYAHNCGRGYALRTGIAAARGGIIVTTEIDLSWGETTVQRLVAAMERWRDADIVVASPHLEGGGYKNVPWKRVWYSRMGNRLIRACMSNAVTMNTGMTRAYRREIIQSLPLSEDRKEFHLEVIMKATALGVRIREIPAILEWKEYKHRGQRVRRKSSSQVNRLIVSHTLFSLFANPVRYVWTMSLASVMLGLAWLGFAGVLFYVEMVSAYTALMGMSLVILAIVLFVLGVILKQGNLIQRELWIMQSYQLRMQRRNESPVQENVLEVAVKDSDTR